MPYILLGTVIWGIVWGIVVSKVIENKGYEENWFWWGFFFGIFALIIALTKQSVNTTKVVIESSAPVKENMELLSSCMLNNQVNVSSPIHIASWEIKKDAEKLVLFVDFINVSHKEISAVMFSATGFNAFGDIVRVNDAEFFDVIGQDLSIRSNGQGKVYTTLQDEAIRKVEIKVKKICFADGTIVDDIQDEWINTNQSELKPVHIDCARRENTQSKYYAIIKEHYWQCVCGFVNKQNTCTTCGMKKNHAIKYTQDNFDSTYNEYLKQIEIEKLQEEERKLEEKRLQEEQQARVKKVKKIIACSTGVIAICIVMVMVLNSFVIPTYKYNKALKLYNKKEYTQSQKAFMELNGFKNSGEMIMKILNSQKKSISAGYVHSVGLKSDGTVVATNYTRDNAFFDQYTGQCDVHEWKDIVTISAGRWHTVGLKLDGTVVAVGSNDYGQCNVQEWKDIVAISAGDEHTIGLKLDGTVVATSYLGQNYCGQCNVQEWKDIVAISAGGRHTVGLKSNGTVIATIYENISGEYLYSYVGQCNVQEWKDIVAISAGDEHTIGLKSDGTVVATNYNGDNTLFEYNGQCDVHDWKDIVAISAGSRHTIGLKSDGTVVATNYIEDTISIFEYNGQCDVQSWKDIVAISAGDEHTMGLKSDGTVIATSYIENNGLSRQHGRCNVHGWRNINRIWK